MHSASVNQEAFWFQDPFVFFWFFGALVTLHWSTSAPKGTALGTNALKTIRTPGPAPRECGNDGREQGRHPLGRLPGEILLSEVCRN